MHLHFQTKEFFFFSWSFSSDIINKYFYLNYSFLHRWTFSVLIYWVHLLWKHGRTQVFLKLLFCFDSYVAKIRGYIARDPTVRNNCYRFEKGSLLNHTYFNRAISLGISESFNKFRSAFFFKFYSNNAHILTNCSVCYDIFSVSCFSYHTSQPPSYYLLALFIHFQQYLHSKFPM